MLVEGTAGPATEPNESATLPFVIPSEAEGSAVHSTFATKVHGKNELSSRIFRSSWMRVEGTAGPSTALRSGRDDKFTAPERLNCRSLGFARDDKGEGGASIGCDGGNDGRSGRCLPETLVLRLNEPGFLPEQVADRLPPADQPGSLPFDHDFRRAGPGIVV